jgi:hypothetical protein
LAFLRKPNKTDADLRDGKVHKAPRGQADYHARTTDFKRFPFNNFTYRDSPAVRPAGIAPRINALPDLPERASYTLTPPNIGMYSTA